MHRAHLSRKLDARSAADPVRFAARHRSSRVEPAADAALQGRDGQVAYELPNGSKGQASLAAVPVVDGESRIGAVIVFEDATRMATLASGLAALKGRKWRQG